MYPFACLLIGTRQVFSRATGAEPHIFETKPGPSFTDYESWRSRHEGYDNRSNTICLLMTAWFPLSEKCSRSTRTTIYLRSVKWNLLRLSKSNRRSSRPLMPP